MLSRTIKKRVIKEHSDHEKDTGSAPVQIAVLSRQIEELTKHLKDHPKDLHSRRGLLKMVNRRRRLLSWLNKNDPDRYQKVVKKLGLKK